MYKAFDEGNRSRAFDAGMLTGIAFGAAFALLYAPMRGDTLRRQLDATFRRVRDDLTRQYAEIERDVQRDFHEIQRAFADVQADFRNTTRELLGGPAEPRPASSDYPS